MAYPGEKEHVSYLEYVERHAMGEEKGAFMSKDQWRKKQKKKKAKVKANR
jgi:hypothetical protein